MWERLDDVIMGGQSDSGLQAAAEGQTPGAVWRGDLITQVPFHLIRGSMGDMKGRGRGWCCVQGRLDHPGGGGGGKRGGGRSRKGREVGAQKCSDKV